MSSHCRLLLHHAMIRSNCAERQQNWLRPALLAWSRISSISNHVHIIKWLYSCTGRSYSFKKIYFFSSSSSSSSSYERKSSSCTIRLLFVQENFPLVQDTIALLQWDIMLLQDDIIPLCGCFLSVNLLLQNENPLIISIPVWKCNSCSHFLNLILSSVLKYKLAMLI